MLSLLFRHFAVSISLCVLGGAAIACEPAIYDAAEYAKADTPLKLYADGSFKDSSADGQRIGYPVRDRGNMRIAQRLQYNNPCWEGEELLVVDCSTADLVVLRGKPGPDSFSLGGALFTTVAQIQKPMGPIEVTSESTIIGLIKIAEKNDIKYYTDFVSVQRQDKRKNRYDAYYGCRLYYPDSAGARMPKP